MNKKQVIRLNEAQFNRLVKETVKRVLKEEFQYKVMDDYPYKDAIELQPEGEPNGNSHRYVQVVMGGQGGTWSEFKPIYLDDKDIFVDKMGSLCTKDGRILHGTPNNDDVCKPNKPFGRFRDNEGTWL